MAEKPLPHNTETERSILGAVLLDKAAWQQVATLSAGEFFLDSHRKIFAAIQHLYGGGAAVDAVILCEELTRRGELESIGGAAYLSSLTDGLPKLSSVEHYVKIVKEKALRRRLIGVCDGITRRAEEQSEDIDGLMESAQGLIRSLNPGNSTSLIRLVGADEFLERQSADEQPYLIENLLPSRSQTLWQGRPKVGKSHTLLQLVFDAAAGYPVFDRFRVARPIRSCYVELEEPEAETKKRFAAMLRAHNGQGPDKENLSFLTKTDLYKMRLLPRELLFTRRADFIRAIKDKGVELLVLVALRKLVAGNLSDPEIAEGVNEALDMLSEKTGAAIAVAHHTRKSPADTAEARGFGSTMIAARADAVFDISRTGDGLRRVEAEARYSVEEKFLLKRDGVGDGELIRFAEDSEAAKVQELKRRVGQGESINKAAKAVGIPYATAHRHVHGDD